MRDVAPILFLNGLNQLLVQLFLVKHLERWLSIRGIILMGYFFGALNCVVLSFVPSFYGLYVLALTSGLGVIFAPAIEALYMNAAQMQEMGKVQGAVNSLMTLTSGVGPVLYSQLLVMDQDRGGSFFGGLSRPVSAPFRRHFGRFKPLRRHLLDPLRADDRVQLLLQLGGHGDGPAGESRRRPRRAVGVLLGPCEVRIEGVSSCEKRLGSHQRLIEEGYKATRLITHHCMRYRSIMRNNVAL